MVDFHGDLPSGYLVYIWFIRYVDGFNGIFIWLILMGVSENVVYPIVPNGFADHYPY